MTPARSLAARYAAHRPSSLAAVACLVVAGLLHACGTEGTPAAPSETAPPTGAVRFTGSARSWVTPSTLPTPPFAGVSVTLVGFEDLADPNLAAPPERASGAVQSAATGCQADGCTFRLPSVSLAGVERGLLARLDATGGLAKGQYQPSYTLVTSPNQITVSKQSGGALDAFAPATLPSAATVDNFAKLAGVTTAELLARGAAVAFVSSTRQNGDTLGRGVGAARLTLTAGPTGAAVLYPNDDYRQVQTTGANKDGAVLVVGPALGAGAAAPASYAYPVSVAVAATGLTFSNNAVILRPGTLVLVAILPVR